MDTCNTHLKPKYRQVSCWICCSICQSSKVHGQEHDNITCIIPCSSSLPKPFAVLQELGLHATALHESHSRNSAASYSHPVCMEISSHLLCAVRLTAMMECASFRRSQSLTLKVNAVRLSEGSGRKQTNNQHKMTTVVSGGLPLRFWYQTSSRCIVHTFG